MDEGSVDSGLELSPRIISSRLHKVQGPWRGEDGDDVGDEEDDEDETTITAFALSRASLVTGRPSDLWDKPRRFL
jgi:hypothetical protein